MLNEPLGRTSLKNIWVTTLQNKRAVSYVRLESPANDAMVGYECCASPTAVKDLILNSDSRRGLILIRITSKHDNIYLHMHFTEEICLPCSTIASVLYEFYRQDEKNLKCAVYIDAKQDECSKAKCLGITQEERDHGGGDCGGGETAGVV